MLCFPFSFVQWYLFQLFLLLKTPIQLNQCLILLLRKDSVVRQEIRMLWSFYLDLQPVFFYSRPLKKQRLITVTKSDIKS